MFEELAGDKKCIFVTGIGCLKCWLSRNMCGGVIRTRNICTRTILHQGWAFESPVPVIFFLTGGSMYKCRRTNELA